MTNGTSLLSPNRNLRAGHAADGGGHGSRQSLPAHSDAKTDRVQWLGLACLVLGVWGVARWLTPDARGFGTHLQLGLPACGFLSLTGLPCPACGLTTCFAHMARGEFALAAHTHPVGVLLFACMSACLPLAVWAGVRGRPFGATLVRLHVYGACAAVGGAALGQWVLRVAALLLR
jgi:Protein of unknown function (DUF2752)